MQGYVPLNLSCKKKKIKIISILSFILIGVLIVFIIFLIPEQKNEKYFKQKSYFFVTATNSQKSSALSSSQNLLISLGGAGVTYCFNDNYYLIVNVYSTKSEADEIKNNIVNTFPQAEVIEVKTKQISRKKKNLIKNNENVYKLVKFVYEFLEYYQDYSIKYLSGKISESKFCTSLIEKKLELEEIIKNLNNGESSLIEKNALNVGQLILLHFNNFFNNYYTSSKKESLVCSLGVNIAIERINLFDNL